MNYIEKQSNGGLWEWEREKKIPGLKNYLPNKPGLQASV